MLGIMTYGDRLKRLIGLRYWQDTKGLSMENAKKVFLSRSNEKGFCKTRCPKQIEQFWSSKPPIFLEFILLYHWTTDTGIHVAQWFMKSGQRIYLDFLCLRLVASQLASYTSASTKEPKLYFVMFYLFSVSTIACTNGSNQWCWWTTPSKGPENVCL